MTIIGILKFKCLLGIWTLHRSSYRSNANPLLLFKYCSPLYMATEYDSEFPVVLRMKEKHNLWFWLHSSVLESHQSSLQQLRVHIQGWNKHLKLLIPLNQVQVQSLLLIILFWCCQITHLYVTSIYSYSKVPLYP